MTQTTAPDILTFAEAESVGQALHDHWRKMAGKAPMPRDDLGWGDIVQFTIRTARNLAEKREEADGHR